MSTAPLGRLVFDRMPLSEVVAEIDRYRRGRTIILDARLAGRRVSGVFLATDIHSALSLIAGELGARIATIPPFVTLLY